MTDREKYLTILDRFYRGRGGSLLTKDESEALDYAISSIKTDLKYDLLYEETKHIANVSKKVEPTPDDCETCIHNKGVLECDMYGCEYEPSGDDVVSRDVVKEQMIMYGFYAPDMTVTEFVEDLPPVNPKNPTTKNNLGVKLISKSDVDRIIDCPYFRQADKLIQIMNLPSVTLQESRWTPVSEKLPDIHNYSDNYLVTLKRGGVHIAMFTECDGKHWWTYDDVTAWMSLPKSYREVKV